MGSFLGVVVIRTVAIRRLLKKRRAIFREVAKYIMRKTGRASKDAFDY
jgi:hypothetical protein